MEIQAISDTAIGAIVAGVPAVIAAVTALVVAVTGFWAQVKHQNDPAAHGGLAHPDPPAK